MDEAHYYLGLMHFAKKYALEKQFLAKDRMAVVGLEVPHTHVHLIPLNEMDEMRFQNKVSLSAVEFEALAEKLKLNVAFQIKWYSFRLEGR
jgi:histidine triad (HIT) family protein